MRSLIPYLLAPCLAGVATGQQASFSDQTVASGLVFTHDTSDDHPGGMHTGGACVGDFNNDGWPDVYCSGGGDVADALFINNQDGTFSDMAASYGIDVMHRGGGAAAGDFNNDGWCDLYVVSQGDMAGAPTDGHHKLWRNNGDGTMTDIAVSAGVNATAVGLAMADGYGATFGDYDLDGDLDLYAAGWIDDNQSSRLFRNNGDETFTDVTAALGLDDLDIKGFTPRIVDMNGDRRPEIALAADFGSMRYWSNVDLNTFADVTDTAVNDVCWNGMGATIADLNNDGTADWYMQGIWRDDGTSNGTGNRLFWNNGDDTFTEAPLASGVVNGGWGWGVEALDVNHDGHTDLFATNGISMNPEWVGEQCYLFVNQGNETFVERAATSGCALIADGRGVVYLDYDRDGDLDIVHSGFLEPITLLRNDIDQTPTSNVNWLMIDLDTSDADGLAPDGMQSKIEIEHNGMTQTHWVHSGSSYLGTSETVAHFGVGTDTMIDMIKVTWPNGFVSKMMGVVANQRLTISAPNALSSTPLVRGQTADFMVEGADGQELVRVLYSTAGQGMGQCIAQGICLDLLDPVAQAGTGISDMDGDVTVQVFVPASAPPATVAIQALIYRGQTSALSNVLVETLQ